MKTRATIKQTLLALTIALSIASCKKDKKTDPEPAPVEVKAMTLTDLKALSTGASVKVPDARKITGVVISDANAKNIDSKTVVLQDAAAQNGIIVTFDAAQTFVAGDQLEVNISGQTLAQTDGEIVVQSVPAANAKKTGTGAVTPKAATIAEINTNKVAWDGTLVTIAATELSGGNGKYTGSLVVKDASGTSATRILAGASFAGDDYPVSVSSLTGIVRISGTNTFIDIRKPADVTIGAVSRVVTEIFDNLASTGRDFSAAGNMVSFTSTTGQWTSTGLNNLYTLPGNLYDGDILTATRNYLYSCRTLTAGAIPGSTVANLSSLYTNLQGLKTVTITFAGSKANEYRTVSAGAIKSNAINPFDPAVDFVQIGVYPKDPAPGNYSLASPQGIPFSDLLKVSPQYKKTGEWYTFTYTLPTKAELIAAGVTEDMADAFIANPNIIIGSYGTRTGTVSTITSFAPIVIDKVVFGF